MSFELNNVLPEALSARFSAPKYVTGGLIKDGFQKEAVSYTARGNEGDLCLIKSALEKNGYAVVFERKIDETAVRRFIL